MFALPYALIYLGETRVHRGLAAVLFALQPIFAVVFAHFMLARERFRPAQLLGMLLGLSGVALVCLYSVHGRSEWLGAAAVLASGVIQGFTAVYFKKHHEDLPTFSTAGFGSLFAAILLAVPALLLEPHPVKQWDFKGVFSLLYLAAFGSALAFVMVFRLFRVWEATKTSTISLVTPPLALFWGWLILKEPLGWNYVAGSALVIVGIWQANRVPPRSA